jgi:dihydrofolate reductase
MKQNYKLIVAYDDNFGIGLNNSIPWYLPNDLKRFKELTLNSNVIMGYKTFESIIKRNNKPLPKRNNIVLTRKNISSEYDNCFFFNKIEKILDEYKEAWIIGGQEIYEIFFPFVNEVFVTKVKGLFNCDKFFTIKDYLNWKITYKEDFENYSFINYSKC